MANGSQGLQIVDVSDPAACTGVGLRAARTLPGAGDIGGGGASTARELDFGLGCAQTIDARFDLGPDVGSRLHRPHVIEQRSEMRFPLRHLRCERDVGCLASARRQQLLAFEQPERIFGRERRVVTHGIVPAAHSPASRHVRSFMSPRRIQLFIVPSGTSRSSASSA